MKRTRSGQSYASSDASNDNNIIISNKRSKGRARSSRSQDPQEDEFEVAKILDERYSNGRKEYLVWWTEYKMNQATWEPLAHLKNCKDLLKKFQEEREELKEKEARNLLRGSPFDILPVEMKLKIFSHMSLLTQRSCRLVCKEWKGIIESSLVKFHPVLSDETLESVSRSRVEFSNVIVKDLSRMILPHRRHARQLSALNVKSTKLTIASRSEDDNSVSSKNLQLLLRMNCSKLLELTFEKGSFSVLGEGREPPKMTFALLNQLEIYLSWSFVGFYEDLSRLRLFTGWSTPRLSTLVLNVDGNPDDHHRIYLGLFSLVAQLNKEGTIRNLTLSLYRYYSFNFQQPDSLLQLYLQDVRDDLKANLKLNSLCLAIDRYEGHPGIYLGFELLASQTALESLEIRLNTTSAQDVEKRVRLSLETNASTLKEFTLRRCLCNIKTNSEVTTDYSSRLASVLAGLKPCTKLTSFKLYLEGQRVPSFTSRLPPSLQEIRVRGNFGPDFFRGLGKSSRFPQLLLLSIDDTSRSEDSPEPSSRLLVESVRDLMSSAPQLRQLELHNGEVDPRKEFPEFSPQVTIRGYIRNRSGWHLYQNRCR